ncbi:YfgM family protein [Diaphorobacter aerolatus]|uniref:Ancillary SecYEG translocon subunit n=1 Tax=Diaphorobacter aerolatus TaxID=1288495 RepID=A0A7H0GIL5_9BURK|nr:tetratricopeptide repeat protein [Diaphorobacter aerolatus]QNP48131.1 tetratricopeptide repeat protein [Diaphorobacter aerolatus]
MANHFDLEEQEQLDQIKHFWKQWGTLITAVVVLVCGGFAAWSGYNYWQSRQATQAAVLFDEVDSAAEAKDVQRLQRAFDDMKSRYGSTAQAGQAGLTTAKVLVDAKNLDGAKSALEWVAKDSKFEGQKAIARLRLAAVLMEQKAYPEALKQLEGSVPPEFAASFADRRGDVLALSGDAKAAIAAYQEAHAKLDPRSNYRRLIEAKLNSLGATVQVAAAQTTGSSQ